jgi:hypothetical protein
MDSQKPFPGEKLCLVSWIDQNDLHDKKLADSITFNAIIEDLSKKGYSCSYFYDGEFGKIKLFMNLFWEFKNKKKSPNSSIRQHPLLSNIFSMFITFYSLISFAFKTDVKKKLGTFDTIIVAGPSLLAPIYRVFKRDKYLVLYELNIESELFISNILGKKTFIVKLVYGLIKKIESWAINLSNMIMTISPRDCNVLKALVPTKEIMNYYPFYKREISFTARRPLNLIDNKRKTEVTIDDSLTVIGFIGSCSIVNCRALSQIVSIVKGVNSKYLAFLISGNLSDCFCAGNMPNSMIFTGFLENLDILMPLCDAYILFDVQSTGIEVKIQSYKLYKKPVLVISSFPSPNYQQFLGDQMINLKSSEEAIRFIREMIGKKSSAI